jgi:hypothetical protein
MFNTTRIFAVVVLSTFCSRVSALDAAANSSVQSPVSAATSAASREARYSTAFSSTQNPISEGGRFITSTTPGVNWSGLRLGGCGCLPVAPIAITAPGLAQSPNIGGRVGDALAVATGTWGPDQTVTIKVADIPPTRKGYEEIEIRLRTDPATGRGYEIAWAYNHQYLLIAAWNGGGVAGAPAYTTFVDARGPQYAISPGDTLRASISGNVITVHTNGKQIYQYTDTKNSFALGNPGFGFNEGPAGNYGIKSFSAISSGGHGQ